MSKAELVINAKRYVLSCEPGQEERLNALGNRLDKRVHAMSNAMGDIGTERLFLAAALSILDELDECEKKSGIKSLEERIAAIETRAAKALSEAAGRIETLSNQLAKAN